MRMNGSKIQNRQRRRLLLVVVVLVEVMEASEVIDVMPQRGVIIHLRCNRCGRSSTSSLLEAPLPSALLPSTAAAAVTPSPLAADGCPYTEEIRLIRLLVFWTGLHRSRPPLMVLAE
ncbi:hypothetical protein Vretimale_4323 [Volvox reticuliferus]|uniref:Secreted protein n=1 Tax=Volvox reticuliferus TaxID=1737510 RepID=A0A8J4C3N1_9CHLO|nr:hypothetical protein Vretifemale_2909 [Volvox reticuliferus]GIL99066.1 hypothetical protein Vretimale_4323 [Volvox reticuliferus]